jgi:hypothetical protein
MAITVDEDTNLICLRRSTVLRTRPAAPEARHSGVVLTTTGIARMRSVVHGGKRFSSSRRVA